MTPRIYRTIAARITSSRWIMGALIAFAGIGIPLYALMGSRLSRIAAPAVLGAWLVVLVVVWFGPRDSGPQGITRVPGPSNPWALAISLDLFFVVWVAWLIGWVTVE